MKKTNKQKQKVTNRWISEFQTVCELPPTVRQRRKRRMYIAKNSCSNDSKFDNYSNNNNNDKRQPQVHKTNIGKG